ncbi:MAG: VTT domain-containing protein [Candidatus Sungbacteria bacterium]|nr:VTT domain-containing protein [Candidatus Sungbacteria bacterium]
MSGLDLVSFIKGIGYLGLFGIVFAESGLLIGFVLPGDSLLFTAGFLASQGYLNIWILVPLTFIAAVLGDSFGYAFGRKVGPHIFSREDSIVFHKQNLLRAQAFYERYGGKALVLARFMPFVRTFAPILAGVGKMHYGKFLFYNVLGGAFWAIGLPLFGYYLGAFIPNVDRYILLIVFLIVLISISPGIVHIARDRGHRNEIMNAIRRFIRR